MSGPGDYVERASADKYNDEYAWKREYKRDPRVNAGITCAARYCSAMGGAVPAGKTRQQFACVPCGLRKTLVVDPADADGEIGFACPACRAQTTHSPVGVPTPSSNPFPLPKYD